MQNIFLITGAVLAALAVGFGAFGAHALQSFLEDTGRSGTYETAVKYQFYHAFGMMVLGLLLFKYQSPLLIYSGWCMVAGVLLFSGALYVLCLTGYSKLGMVAPVGGLLFILGWVLLAAGMLRSI